MSNFPNISLQAAMTLTEWSERTIRRRIADGTLTCAEESGTYNKTLIRFESIERDLCIPLSSDDVELVEQADAGVAAAQNDLGLVFVSHGKWKSAIYWLEAAAKQNFPDAMQWLGECYLNGLGVEKDRHLAVMWIAKAASLGHAIAKLQIEAMRPGADGVGASFKDRLELT
ncbi:tetratricopeptide repeat protein [Methylomonas sp. MgM2]